MAEPDLVERFTAVYEAHHRQVYGYAVTRVGRQLADEVVGDTFLVAWRRLPVVPRHAPLPWLLGVARNVVRERYRVEVRQQALAGELRVWLADERDVADGITERAAVLAALARLADDDRELLTLVAWHGLTPREAAKVVGCSTATYSVRLHRARRRLRDAMSATDQVARPAATVEVARPVPTVLVPKEFTR